MAQFCAVVVAEQTLSSRQNRTLLAKIRTQHAGAPIFGKLDIVADNENEAGYLRRVEALATRVVGCAESEGWLSYPTDPDNASELQKAVNELARNLRHVHYDGDGCIDGRDEDTGPDD